MRVLFYSGVSMEWVGLSKAVSQCSDVTNVIHTYFAYV
jgi:hypothetical protein